MNWDNLPFHRSPGVFYPQQFEIFPSKQSLEVVFSLLLEAHYLCPDDPHCNSLQTILIGLNRGFKKKKCCIPRALALAPYYPFKKENPSPYRDFIFYLRKFVLPEDSLRDSPDEKARGDLGEMRMMFLGRCYPLLEKDADVFPSKLVFSPFSWFRKHIPEMLQDISFVANQKWEISMYDDIPTCTYDVDYHYFYRFYYYQNSQGKVHIFSELRYRGKIFIDEENGFPNSDLSRFFK